MIKLPKSKIVLLLLSLCFPTAIAVLSVRLTIAQTQHPTPQAILVLGGSEDREIFTVQFAQAHSHLPIWISSGSRLRRQILQRSPLSNPIYFDDRATDTVTNFTTLADNFQRRGIHHLYLITSDYHLPRSQAIAFVVLGSRGIAYTPVAVPSNYPPESKIRIVRDIGRSLLWVVTGRSGASLNLRNWVKAPTVQNSDT